jgi:hypothetical protein
VAPSSAASILRSGLRIKRAYAPGCTTHPSTVNTILHLRLSARRRWTISPGHARGGAPTNTPKLALLIQRRGVSFGFSTRAVSVGSSTLHGARPYAVTYGQGATVETHGRVGLAAGCRGRTARGELGEASMLSHPIALVRYASGRRRCDIRPIQELLGPHMRYVALEVNEVRC